MIRRLRIVGIATLIASVVGVLFAEQFRAVMAAAGHPVSFGAAFAIQAVPWYLWVLFLPVILEVPERWPVCPGLLRLLAINVTLGLTLTGAHLLLSQAILHRVTTDPWPVALGYPPGIGSIQLIQVAGGLVIYGVLVALAYLEHYRRAFHESEIQSARLNARVVTAELSSLRAQLCPHFLFNTLNSACGLISEDPERAELMIAKLSQLLRLALQTEGIAEVSLAKELEFASAYLEVERIRFADRMRISIDVPAELRMLLVPNFLLQPLVENAVHHAVATSDDPRMLELVAFRRPGVLVIEVRDDGPGLLPGALERRREAIGLKTTRSRLEHLYGTASSFTVQNRPTGGTVAQVVVPFRLDYSADLRVPQVA